MCKTPDSISQSPTRLASWVSRPLLSANGNETVIVNSRVLEQIEDLTVEPCVISLLEHATWDEFQRLASEMSKRLSHF